MKKQRWKLKQKKKIKAYNVNDLEIYELCVLYRWPFLFQAQYEMHFHLICFEIETIDGEFKTLFKTYTSDCLKIAKLENENKSMFVCFYHYTKK